nr:adenylate kinase [Granulicella tundricola]
MSETVDLDSTSKAQVEDGFQPGPVLLLGAPGVGKGTQAKILMGKFGIPQISTGDILRDHRARHTQLGLAADELMSKGQLVPDDLVNQMVEVRLAGTDCATGYILDGYPRTLAQANALDSFLQSDAGEPENATPVVAISIMVDQEGLLKRITGRRLCAQCKHIYNIYSNPPKVAGICDTDGSVLEQRKDDTEEIFEERMREFHTLTAPVIPHYRAQGRFLEINGDRSVGEVTESIEEALRMLRARVTG